MPARSWYTKKRRKAGFALRIRGRQKHSPKSPASLKKVSLQKIVLTLLFSLPSLALADTFNYVFITGDKNVGHLNAETKGDQTTIDYDVKNNGRGPTIAESITLDAAGLPNEWNVKGATTFGSKIAEQFSRKNTRAEWVDSTGKGHSTIRTPSIYLAQSSSPWANGVYARALLKTADMQ